MLSFFSLFFCVQLGGVLLLKYGKKRLRTKVLQQTQKTTIIIPFKNEKSRILPLLNSINQSAITYKKSNLFRHFQFLFIDDHSTDGTSQFIIDNLDISYQIFKLKNTSGKKYAIKKGVEESKFERILTLDADVSFKVDYLNVISKTGCKNLTILPVEMYGESVLQNLFSMEFWFLQYFTFGLAGFEKYELCNGANLLVTKKTFISALKVRTDSLMPSGDDMFLLKAVKELKLSITAIDSSAYCVYTPVATTFNSLLIQRLRWISKTKDVAPILMGGIVLLSNSIFYISIFYILNGDFYFVFPILLKIVSELLVSNKPSKWFYVLLHQFYYPIYLIVIVLKLMRKQKMEWR